MKCAPVGALCEAMDGSLVQGDAKVVISGGVSTDTRSLSQGALFFALKGENFDAHHFLEFVHDIDYNFLNKNPELNNEIAKLPGEKIIFTNGSKKHAERVIERLGVEENFQKIFDIVDCDFIPKPEVEPYEKLVKTYNINCKNSIFIEDIAKNLEPAHNMGMKTAWIENDDPYCKKGFDGNHVHYTVKNLTEFLKQTNNLIGE